ncbi:MAG: putative toxin-antitoxin system toxin component, PIN family [Planctomycetota bacterium]
MKVVLDTNVYVSALLFRGVPGQVVALARARRFTTYLSPPMLDELGGVLSSKFGWSAALVDDATAAIRGFATVVHRQPRSTA